MFGIGLPELLLIMALALIVVGPEKLPELAKSLAKGMFELKKTAAALKESLDEETTALEKPWERLPHEPGSPFPIDPDAPDDGEYTPRAADGSPLPQPEQEAAAGGDDNAAEEGPYPTAADLMAPPAEEGPTAAAEGAASAETATAEEGPDKDRSG